MSIDPTGLPACTQEDGSDPGQQFPCHWDAALMGNGQGTSFVMTDQDTTVYDLAPALTSQPVAEPVAPLPATTTSTEQVLTAPAHSELAHTGPTDPILWCVAALMVTIGAVLAPVGKRRRVVTR